MLVSRENYRVARAVLATAVMAAIITSPLCASVCAATICVPSSNAAPSECHEGIADLNSDTPQSNFRATNVCNLSDIPSALVNENTSRLKQRAESGTVLVASLAVPTALPETARELSSHPANDTICAPDNSALHSVLRI
jgi:hypothetical protein